MKQLLLLLSATCAFIIGCNTPSAEKQKEPEIKSPQTQSKETASVSATSPALTDTAALPKKEKANELSNRDNLVGFWFVPHNATVNIRFEKDGRFLFNDFNRSLEKEELLTGRFELVNGTLTLFYDDRPKQQFSFYRGKGADDNYYIKNSSGYYFVKGEAPEE